MNAMIMILLVCERLEAFIIYMVLCFKLLHEALMNLNQ